MTGQHQASPIEATLIPGDGIGPEIVDAVQVVFEALGSPFVWDAQQAGMAAIQKSGDALPAETLASIRRTKLALKGPLTTPIGGGFGASAEGSCCGSAARSWNGALRICTKPARCDECICGITEIFSSDCWCTWRRLTWDW